MAYAQNRPMRHRRGRPAAVTATAAVLFLALAAGCQGGGGGPLSRWRIAHDDSLSRPPTDEEVGDSRSLIARWLHPEVQPTSVADVLANTLGRTAPGSPLGVAPKPDPEAEAEFRAAEALYQQGNLADAETAFARLARRRKNTAWGEKAQFYLAESQFQQGKYVASHESFETLFADYPGTQFQEKAVGREFEIAQAWLKVGESDTPPEQQTSVSNWWKGRHPAVDVSGHALAVLEHVRHHDPLGPLADDAVMKIADYHFAAGNYEDASYHYDQLLADHPKSELAHRAHLASIDAKLKAYVGPDYDGAGLEDARKLVLQTKSQFPEQQASYSDELDHTLALIEDQMAERAFRRGEHYLWTGKVTSAEYCFGEIPARWPRSPWATKAREQLTRIAGMPRKETQASKMMTQPGSSDPLTGGAQAGGMGGMGTPGGMGNPNGLGAMGMGGP